MSISQQEHDATRASPANLTRAQALLIDYLRDPSPNAPPTCPVCGYNLKALTRPVCPECRHELVISVGVTNLGLGWLLIALVPGFFCGIAACLLAIPTTAIYFEDGQIVWPFVSAVLFGWCSGIFAIMLAFGWRGRGLKRRRNRNRFLALARSRQRWFVLILLLIHLAAFGAFFAWVASQI